MIPTHREIAAKIVDIKASIDISVEDALCIVSEECAELTQAVMKMRRVLTGTNPTPKMKDEVMANLVEEIADVENAILILRQKLDITSNAVASIQRAKLERWEQRLIECDKEKDSHE